MSPRFIASVFPSCHDADTCSHDPYFPLLQRLLLTNDNCWNFECHGQDDVFLGETDSSSPHRVIGRDRSQLEHIVSRIQSDLNEAHKVGYKKRWNWRHTSLKYRHRQTTVEANTDAVFVSVWEGYHGGNSGNTVESVLRVSLGYRVGRTIADTRKGNTAVEGACSRRRAAPSVKVCSYDLDDCISYFSNTASNIDVYVPVHKTNVYDLLRTGCFACGRTNVMKNLSSYLWSWLPCRIKKSAILVWSGHWTRHP